MTLFLDCDDTLILWGAEEDWTVNDALVAKLMYWRHANPVTPIVVWSGGGQGYAYQWLRWCLTFEGMFQPDSSGASYARALAREFDLHLKGWWEPISASSKDLTLPQATDLCIDDQRIKVPCPVYTADEFPWEGYV